MFYLDCMTAADSEEARQHILMTIFDGRFLAGLEVPREKTSNFRLNASRRFLFMIAVLIN
jgi:hypothetical protein